jgi:2-oxoglutarate dehydrogenase E2 component (dihydrolipoamide succinyltransferase)
VSVAVEVKVPRLSESISEAVLAEWLKPDGASVRSDEPVATLETDKAAVEITAPESGVLHHARAPGDRVIVGDVIARVEPGAAGATPSTPAVTAPAATAPAAPPAAIAPAAPPAATAPAAPPAATAPAAPAGARGAAVRPEGGSVPVAPPAGPAARRLLEERALGPGDVTGSGRGGRILKEDVTGVAGAAEAGIRGVSMPGPRPAALAAASGERVVPMSRIRQRIAERLVQAQHGAAILTTFNEIDMSAVLDARQRYRDRFEQKHGVRLGFMSFFARACVTALREVPEVNAEIRGTDLVYHDRVHLGVAVGTDRGLIVPVVRDAQAMGFADIEREIARLATRARDATITLDELGGGTFTISNGGVYGSLLSTPILNPPQSGILGMHKIEKRPVVADDQVVVRPMMYVALSYDHRVVDGEQAVTFLVRVKEQLEAPERMLLEV